MVIFFWIVFDWLNRRKHYHRLAPLQEIEVYDVRDCRETGKAGAVAGCEIFPSSQIELETGRSINVDTPPS